MNWSKLWETYIMIPKKESELGLVSISVNDGLERYIKFFPIGW